MITPEGWILIVTTLLGGGLVKTLFDYTTNRHKPKIDSVTSSMNSADMANGILQKTLDTMSNKSAEQAVIIDKQEERISDLTKLLNEYELWINHIYQNWGKLKDSHCPPPRPVVSEEKNECN